MNTGAEKVT